MIKTMLRPFFKRFLGLFFSMVFVSMLSVALLCCFGSSIVNTKNNYVNYVTEYQDMDEPKQHKRATESILTKTMEKNNPRKRLKNGFSMVLIITTQPLLL